MKIITVGALKGGVGKTNFSFNLAGILIKKGHKVLIIDLDPQGNLSSNFNLLNSEKKSNAKELFIEDIEFNEKNLIEKRKFENYEIDIITNNIKMSTLENELIGCISRETILQNNFLKNIDFLQKYDYILFDTNPSINIINVNAFLISDEIILISDNSLNGILGINILNTVWENVCKKFRIKNKINTVVLNNFDSATILSKEFVEFLNESAFKIKILKTQINHLQIFKKSEVDKIPIVFYKQALKEKKDVIYENIYNELVQKAIL